MSHWGYAQNFISVLTLEKWCPQFLTIIIRVIRMRILSFIHLYIVLGYVQVWDTDHLENVSCINYPGRQISAICISDSSDVGYAQVKGDGGSCEIKVMDLSRQNASPLDSLLVREAGASWTLPKASSTFFDILDLIHIQLFALSYHECQQNLSAKKQSVSFILIIYFV